MSARGINKVILVGRLGNDPEVRYIPNGGAVANLQVATSESWRDKQTGRCGSRRNGTVLCCSASSRKWQVNICARARRSTSRGNSVPVAGTTTASPATSLKFLLRPRAPCRCWGVHHSRTLRRNRSLSRMGSHRVLTRRKKKVARKRKAVDVRPRSPSLSRKRRRGRITGFQTTSRSDRADCDNRPALCGASPEI